MRINDLLIEAGLKPADFKEKNRHYWKNLLSLIQKDSELELEGGGSIKVQNPQQVYNDLSSIWSADEFATDDQINQIKKYKIPSTDGKSVLVSKIFKSDQIKNTNAPSDSEETKLSKFWNLGNVLECVMGAAVTAKFINPEQTIEWKGIVAILRQMEAGAPGLDAKGKPSKLVPYSMSTMARNDNLTFAMSLNAVDFKALQMSYADANTLQQYPNHEEIFKAYTDAAQYVNTADTVKTAIERVTSDKNKNTIIIESEGASSEKQTSTKADLFITIDNVKERLLSLKSKATPQVGQVSGHAFENLEEFFKSTLGFGLPGNFSKMFPKGSFKKVGPEIYQKAFPVAYKHMFGELTKTLSGNSEYKEYDFVKQVYDAIQHHATLGEEVIIVYLSPSAKRSYTELKIGPELFEALKEFDLVPVLAGPTTIKVMGVPVTELGKQITGGKEQEFIQLRSYMQKASTVRNIIEIKTLLKSLADVDLIKQRQITKQKPDELTAIKKNAGIKQVAPPQPVRPTANKPAATNPKPALKVSQPQMGQETAATNPV
jgi:hypothetical protein